MKYTTKDIEKFGTILGIWAHPDDEAFSSAGFMSAAVANRQRVAVVTATKGDAGKSADESRWPAKQLANIREAEQHQSLQATGVTEHYWLNYNDGKLIQAEAIKAIDEIIDILAEVNPDTVITFDQDGITGHDDHRTIHKWALSAVKKSGKVTKVLCAKENQEFYETIGKKLDQKYNMYFNVDKPEVVSIESVSVCYMLSNDEKAKKRQALQAHASQTSDLFKTDDGKIALEKFCECECFSEITL